ncbi:hypothetical protein [Arthrobacter sp. MA-N2]|uniref:hypothetical protein n=1 Tax=Arthrobacter sp. MA-N2 TaxID=1101188 RepID=UPI000484069E|nr:hypothetical protein [Arthrobacter sp. MA-N2]
MSARTDGQEEPVHDGVQNETDPVPKDPAGPPALRNGRPADGPGAAPQDAAGRASGGGAGDPTGPAEEQDDASPDDRGLTTDLTPGD